MPRAVDLRTPTKDHDPLANLLDFGNIDQTAELAGNMIRGAITSALDGVVDLIFETTGLDLQALADVLEGLDFSSPEAFLTSLVTAITALPEALLTLLNELVAMLESAPETLLSMLTQLIDLLNTTPDILGTLVSSLIELLVTLPETLLLLLEHLVEMLTGSPDQLQTLLQSLIDMLLSIPALLVSLAQGLIDSGAGLLGIDSPLDATKLYNMISGAIIPLLDASKIGTGKFLDTLIPNLGAETIMVPTSANALSNPHFTSNVTTGWSTFGGGISWDGAAGHDGLGSLRMDCDGVYNRDHISNRVSCAPGDEIPVAAWLSYAGFNSHGGQPIQLAGQTYLAGAIVDYPVIASLGPTGDGGWQRLSGTFTVPPGVDAFALRLSVRDVGAGVVHWDDAELTVPGAEVPLVEALLDYLTSSSPLDATKLFGLLAAALVPGLDASKIVSGSFPQAMVNITAIAAAIVTGVLGGGQIPALDASKITTGSFTAALIPVLDAATKIAGVLGIAQIPGLPAGQITSGSFAAAMIPLLDASKITTGSFAASLIPVLDAATKIAGVLGIGQIPPLPAGQITSGAFAPGQIPGLDGSKITSGSIAQGFLSITSIAAAIVTGTLNVGQIPGLPAGQITSGAFAPAQIPGLDGSKITGGTVAQAFLQITSIAAGIVTGVLSGGQIPVLDAGTKLSGTAPTSVIPNLGIVKLPDLQALQDEIAQYVFGADAGVNVPLGGAVSALDTHWRTTQSTAAKVADMDSQNVGAAQSGVSVRVDFSDHPDSAEMPNPAVIGNPGLGGWVTTYRTVSGSPTSSLGVKGSGTAWTIVNNGSRIATTHHPVPTNTDYQKLGLTVSSGPTSPNSAWLVGRCNAANTEYVGLRVTNTGFLAYAAELGWVNSAGTFTRWAGPIALPTSVDSELWIGTGGGARNYQYWMAGKKVFDVNEPGTLSPIDAAHRFWGIRGDIDGVNKNAAATFVSAADNQPPSVVGSGCRIIRISTTTVNFSAGASQNDFPASYFDSIQERSSDITPTLATNRLAATREGWYMVSLGVEVTASNSARLALGVKKNGSLYAKGGGWYSPAFGIQSTWILYLNAGEYVTPCYANSDISQWGTRGQSDGSRTFFSMSLLNRSYA